MRRWVDETDDAFERTLLRSAASDGPDPKAVAHAVAGLTAAAGTVVAAHALTAAGASGVGAASAAAASVGALGAGQSASLGAAVLKSVHPAAALGASVAWKWLGAGVVLGGLTTAAVTHVVYEPRVPAAGPTSPARGVASAGPSKSGAHLPADHDAPSELSPAPPTAIDAPSTLANVEAVPAPTALSARAAPARNVRGDETGKTGPTPPSLRAKAGGSSETVGASAPDVPPATVTSPPSSVSSAAPAPVASATEGNAPDVSALTAEVEAVDAARRALESGDAVGALERVKRYERAYPRGVLRPDAEVIAIEAYAAIGGWSEVARRGAVFLSRYPHDPHSGRVRRLSEGPGP